jgi:hypothetical protein
MPVRTCDKTEKVKKAICDEIKAKKLLDGWDIDPQRIRLREKFAEKLT